MYITYLEGVPINFVTVLANTHNYSKMPQKKEKNTNEKKTPYEEGVESSQESDQSEIPDLRRRRGGRQKSKAQVKDAAKVAKKSRQPTMRGARQRGNEGSIQESSELDQFGALDTDALNAAGRRLVSRRPVEAVASDDSIQAVAREEDSGEVNAQPELFPAEYTPYRSVGVGVGSAARALQSLRAVAYTELHNGKSYYSQGV